MSFRLHTTRADVRARTARFATRAPARIRSPRTPAFACAAVTGNDGGMRALDRCRVDGD